MNRAALIAVWLIAVVAALRTPMAQAEPGDDERPPDAREVLDRARKSLAAISSIQYKFEWERVGVGATSNRSRYGNSGEFAFDGGKFFSEYLVTTDKEKWHRYAAFDGQFYQHLDDDVTRLFVSAGLNTLHVPYGAVQPIMKPCALFLGYDMSRGLRFDLVSHQSVAMWEPFQATATLKPPQEIDGHRCSVVEFSKGSGKFLGRIELWAATDLDYYPIRVVSHGGDGEKARQAILDVKELSDLRTPAGRVIVPLKIETVGKDALGTVLSTELATIDRTTLQVNQPIAAERFWLKRLAKGGIAYASNVTADQRATYEQGPK